MATLLLDSHLLLWAAAGDKRLPKTAAGLIEDRNNTLLFSAASIWEVVIKSGLGKEDFRVSAPLLRRGLLENGYLELPVTSAHALQVGNLPHHHRDPFDRILIAQALAEGVELVTTDRRVAHYDAPIRLLE